MHGYKCIYMYIPHTKNGHCTPHSTVHPPYNAALCVSCTVIVGLTCTLMCRLQLHSLFVIHSYITSHAQEFCDNFHSSVTFMCNVYTCTCVYATIHVHAIHSTQPVRIGLHTFHSCTSSMTYMYTMYMYPCLISGC